MLHPVVEDAVESLLMAWRHFDDLSRRNTPHRVRMEARYQLDRLRSRTNRLRRGLHPEPRELDEVALTATCDSLTAPVFIMHRDFLPDGSTYECACGSLVTLSGQLSH